MNHDFLYKLKGSIQQPWSCPATDNAVNGEIEGFQTPDDIVNYPKTYKLLPTEWSRLIKPAGIVHPKGDTVGDCLRMYD